MKKLFLLFAVIIFTGSAFAQLNLNYGITAGANFSTLTNSSTSGNVSTATDYKAGLRAGGFVELGLGNNIGLQGSLLYSQMGGKINFDDGAGNISKLTLGLDYLHIPINFKYSISSIKGLGVFAGPQFGFLLSSRLGDKNNTISSSDLKKSFKSFDFSGNIGVQYELPLGLRFSALYQYSFGNTFKQKDANGTTVLFGNAVNSGISVMVGYTFGKK